MVEWYPWLWRVHVGAVALSLCLFLLRGAWMLVESPRLRERWVRIAPHVVDTVLLVSALLLAAAIRQYPFVHDWLTAKVVALGLYIVLGTVALKRGRTRRARTLALIGALLTFGYIVSVALTHDARGVWTMVSGN